MQGTCELASVGTVTDQTNLDHRIHLRGTHLKVMGAGRDLVRVSYCTHWHMQRRGLVADSIKQGCCTYWHT